MNEQIKELAEQAEWSVRWGNPNNYEEYNRALDEWQEKFAELIIRECIKQCNVNFVGTVGTHPSAHNRGVKKCIDNIKEHFGVEL